MTYTRSGTVDVVRFANDVLDNVVVRDCFRHDVELLYELQSWVFEQVGTFVTIYTASNCWP